MIVSVTNVLQQLTFVRARYQKEKKATLVFFQTQK